MTMKHVTYPVVAVLAFSLLTTNIAPLTGCSSAQVATVENDLTKYAPVVVDALNLACDFDSSPVLCSTGTALINGDLAKLQPALTQYENDLAAGTATVAAYNVLNALFDTFESDSASILSLLRVSSGGSTQEAKNIVLSAETFLAVVEALWPGAPPVVTASLGMPQVAAPKPAPAQFASHLPSGVVFLRKATKSQKKAQARWVKQWTKEFNAAVDLAQSKHPKARLQKVTVCGALCGLGSAIGEFKFGGGDN